MKIFFLMLVSLVVFGISTPAQDWDRYQWGANPGTLASLGGNLRDVDNLAFRTIDNKFLNLLAGRFNLSQTAVRVQAILDGDFGSSILITTGGIDITKNIIPITDFHPGIIVRTGTNAVDRTELQMGSYFLNIATKYTYIQGYFTDVGTSEGPADLLLNPLGGNVGIGITTLPEERLDVADPVTQWSSLKIHREKSSTVDDGEIVLATGVAGWGFVMIGDQQEFSTFYFTAAGVVTLAGDASANVTSTDTDGKLSIYDAGSGVAIKNRLGSTLTIAINVNYYDPVP